MVSLIKLKSMLDFPFFSVERMCFFERKSEKVGVDLLVVNKQ